MDGTASPTLKSRGLIIPRSPGVPGRILAALRKGEYDAALVRAALDTGQPGDVVIDLGAGTGFTSALMVRRGKAAAAHAFEPQPELAAHIAAVHELNSITGSVTAAALGKRKGTATLHVGSNPLRAALTPDPGQGDTQPLEIEVRNFRQTAQALKATVLIADLGGAEAQVLPDLDLSQLRAALVRLHPRLIGTDGTTAIFAAMAEAGLAYNAAASSGKIVSFVRHWPMP